MQEIPFHGFFSNQPGLFAAIAVLSLLIIGYTGSPLIVWSIWLLAVLWGFGAPVVLIGVVAAVLLVFLIKPIRAALITNVVMKIMKSILPKISDTERTALEAGVVWAEKDLFSGKPDFQKLMNESYPELTAEEKAFLNGPVEKACEMIDAWNYWKTREMDQAVWDYMRKEKFLGMIIPKEYGGLGFSALAHSEVVMKLASRSIPACVTVMVPNSLGPAELLVHYGTDEQKNHFLPKLAKGEEIPCFGLTEPMAGSDAGSITSTAVLFKDTDGKIKMRMNWNKRWITLAAISTVIGLAFRLRDPDNLLGKGEDLGITVALIPASTPGVIIGRRHDPLGVPFYNCPTHGKDVVVDADWAIVGGLKNAGYGWHMLMDCLSAGRGISLPAQSTGGAKLATRVTSAHAVVRQQFGVSVGKFEGVEEPLARIFGYNYLLEATRRYTVGALDKGIKPPVVTAMVKYYATELGRKVITDAMDVMGGAGISLGKRNLLAEIYIGTPIGITVEGANILTRTLIVFGQGALRAHPYAYKEVKAAEENDLKGFDEAFWGHVGHVVHNLFRSMLLSITRGYIAPSPVSGPTAVYYRRLTWASASFAILADIAMGSLGGSLKFREKITGRFADILAWMYMGTAVLRRYEAEGRKEEDLPYVHFVMRTALVEIQKSFDGLFDNLKVPGLVWFFKGWLGAWSRINSIGSQASDGLGTRVVKGILNNPELRDRHTEGIYIPTDRQQQMGRLDYAMKVVQQSEAAEKKIRDAIKSKQLPKQKVHTLLDQAKSAGVITAAEYDLMKTSGEVRYDAILVDDFSQEEYHANKG